MPESQYGAGCQQNKGCFVPGKGEIQHDPLWLGQAGETYMKQQDVAYVERPQGDGMDFTQRFQAGVAGCQGVHICQFQTLSSAKAYCNSNPECKGILHRTPKPDGDVQCAGGLGCYEPCKGKLQLDEMFLVTEGQLYERHMVR